MDGSGTGDAAAIALNETGQPVSFPLDLSKGPVYLSLYGTGIRGAAPGSVQVFIGDIPAEVLYAGPQPTLPGLDQVNVRMPAMLAGAGQVSLRLATADATSNPVTLRIR